MSTWPEDHVRLYLTNDLKDMHNMASINRLLDQDSGKMLYTFCAIDSKGDTKTGATQVNIDLILPITKTGDLPSCLKICVDASVMLTYNKNQYDRFFNGSIGAVIDIQSH